MRGKIKIEDDSGDRKYFTIIPNYILNHSTIWDREVYIQMKRIAGEEGTCWTSRNTLAKQCGISLDRLKKSLKYLLEHGWIEYVGKKEVLTRGGIQEVNEYRVCNLWDRNNTFYKEKYKGGSSETTPSPQGGSPLSQRGVVVDSKGGSSGNPKEEPLIQRRSQEEEVAVSLLTKTPREEASNFFSKKEIYTAFLEHLASKGVADSVAQKETEKFISYWTEPNSTGKKLRWEMEKTFEIKRRLSTWFQKVKGFANNSDHNKYTPGIA